MGHRLNYICEESGLIEQYKYCIKYSKKRFQSDIIFLNYYSEQPNLTWKKWFFVVYDYPHIYTSFSTTTQNLSYA